MRECACCTAALPPHIVQLARCLDLAQAIPVEGGCRLGWSRGRAGTSKSVGPTQGLTTAAGWQSRVPSAATPGGACPAPSPGLSRLAVPMQPSYQWRKTPPSRACPAPRCCPRVAGTVSYHMTHHVVKFCSVLPCMGLWLPALSCLCVLSQALMGYQPSGCFLLLCLA